MCMLWCITTVFLTSASVFAQTATITPSQTRTIPVTVRPDVTVNPFNQHMLGVAHANWEHAWGKPFIGQVPGLKQAYTAGQIKLIRYAGGLWSNYVGWQRMPQQTPYTTWQPDRTKFHASFANQVKTSEVYSFHYGTNEIDDLASFASSIGADVMMQVNIANNDPAMWADLVHYTNVEHSYNIKYWELGNEFDHDTALGITPTVYAARLASYIDAMKAVDPSIIIIGGVPASGHDFYLTQDYSGNVTALSQYLTQAAGVRTPSGKKVDALSFHWYQNCNNKVPSDMFEYEFPGTPTNHWSNVYARIWSKIGPSRIQTEIINPSLPGGLQGITELNYDACDFGTAPQNANFSNALWSADVLGRLAYNGLDFMTWYEGYGSQSQGYPSVYSAPNDYSPTGVKLRPSYYTLFMYGNYFGNRMVQVTDPDPSLFSVWASTDTRDPKRLKLMVTNLSSSAIQIPLTFSPFMSSAGKAYVMSNPNPLSMTSTSHVGSGGTTINGTVLQDMNVSGSAATIQGVPVPVSGSSLTYTFQPYSVTALILEQEPPTPTPAPLPGDADGNRVVNVLDFQILANTFGSTTDLRANFNTDTVVNILDYQILANNFGMSG